MSHAKVNVLIVEDEWITLDALRDELEDMGYGISGDALRAKDALLILEKGDTDLAILDINLEHSESGIWLAERIRERFDIPFIFLTAFSDRKTIGRAARTQPYAYLVKPFNRQDLHAAIELALIKFAQRGMEPVPENGEDTPRGELLLKDSIFVKRGLSYEKLPLTRIGYIEAFRNYLELVADGNRFVIRSTLKDFQQKLPDERFLQVHRSYVVNLEKVDVLGGNFVKIGNDEIPLSRSRKASLLERLDLYS